MINNHTAFRSALLIWYEKNQRSLPWRTEPSLYRTVVSEFMLQQTQIKTALPYFDRWMKRFPNFTALANAESEIVLKHWEGLGYYNRARNLHKVAQWMRDSEVVPDSVEAWKDLPGIGDYTAAAITSIAQGVPAAVVDGNVVRVLARLTNEKMVFPNNGKAVDFFKVLANKLLDPESPGDANQAMMEMGATVCTKGNPKCTLCPLQSFCLGFAQGSVADLPKIERAKREKVRLHRGLAIDKKKILDFRDSFKKIKNVPFKRNKENWDKFNVLCNQLFGKIDSKRSEIKKEKIEVSNKKRELLKNLNLKNMDSKIEEWKSLEYTGSIKEEKEFLTVIKKEFENENKKSDEIEIELSKIKSIILDKDSINSEKNKIIKKIEDYKKQISQLENNLTFVSEKSDTSIFSNVHSNIDSFKREIEKLEKNLNLISKS